MKLKVKMKKLPIREIDFSIELIRSDLINYDYIIKLFRELKDSQDNSLIPSDNYEKKKEALLKQLHRDVKLRNKKELIEEFIENMLHLTPKEKIKDEFDNFWDAKKEERLKKLADEINADEEKLKELIREYEFRGKIFDDNIVKALKYKLGILGRSRKLKEIRSKIFKFIDLFEW
jgi:type I restriction enzyme R subunit